MSSMTVRSTKLLRDRGFIVTTVERTIPMPEGVPFRNKKDAFGFGDLLAAHPDHKQIILVQSTDASSLSHRVRKILGIAHDMTDGKQVHEAIEARSNAERWLDAGGKILVHGWGKRGARGKPKRWTVKEREIVSRKGLLLAVDLETNEVKDVTP